MRTNDVPPGKAITKGGNKHSRSDDDNLDWMPYAGSPTDIEDESLPFNRPINKLGKLYLDSESDSWLDSVTC